MRIEAGSSHPLDCAKAVLSVGKSVMKKVSMIAFAILCVQAVTTSFSNQTLVTHNALPSLGIFNPGELSIAEFPRAGIIAAFTASCELGSHLPTPTECSFLGLRAEEYARRKLLKEDEYIYGPKVTKMWFRFPPTPSGIQRVSIGLPSNNTLNYRDAVLFFKSFFLCDFDYFQKHSYEIAKDFHHVHDVLVYGEKNATGYRKQQKVFSTTFDGDVLVHKLHKLGCSKTEIMTFKRVVRKLGDFTWDEMLPTLTKDQRNVLQKVLYFPPHPRELKKLMTKTIRELRDLDQRVFNATQSPIYAAARAHHLFASNIFWKKGNGRFARALTNILLLRWRMPGVAFPNDDEYTSAVEKGEIFFTHYLDELISSHNWSIWQ